MATVTVRKLDDEVIRDLRRSAAERGVSMEQEARDRLRRPLGGAEPGAATPSGDDLEKFVDEILAFGRRLPKVEFDTKEASDELYEYLDRE